MRTSLRSVLLATTGIAILLAIGTGLYRLKEHVENSISNSYRLEAAGELLLEFNEENGRWPDDWESLEHHAAKHHSRLYACKTFDDLRNNIVIDFSVDLRKVDTESIWSAADPQLRLISARTGQTHGATFDPNELIYLHLQREPEKMRTKE